MDIVAESPRVRVASLTLGWLFLVLPVFDALSGFLIAGGVLSEGGVASPSQMGRLLAILLIVASMLLARMDAKILLLGLYPIAVELVMAAFHQSMQALLVGLVQAYKLSYLIFAAAWISSLLKENANLSLVVQLMKLNLLIVATMLLISLLFGVGVETYGGGGGVKGYFASGNAIGIYLGGMLTLILSLKIHERVHVSNLFVLYVLIAMVSVGTKTSILMAMAAMMFWWVATGCRAIWPAAAASIVAIYSQAILAALSFVYEVVLLRWKNADTILNFLSSGRIYYVTNAFEVFLTQQLSLARILIGGGATASYQPISPFVEFDTLETDIFDVFFMYGAIGLVLYIAFFALVAYRLRRRLFLLGGFLLVYAHSALAGHVLLNGMNALVLALYCGIASRGVGGFDASKPDR